MAVLQRPHPISHNPDLLSDCGDGAGYLLVVHLLVRRVDNLGGRKQRDGKNDANEHSIDYGT